MHLTIVPPGRVWQGGALKPEKRRSICAPVTQQAAWLQCLQPMVNTAKWLCLDFLICFFADQSAYDLFMLGSCSKCSPAPLLNLQSSMHVEQEEERET